MVGKETEQAKPADYVKGYKRYLKDFEKECGYSKERLLETA